MMPVRTPTAGCWRRASRFGTSRMRRKSRRCVSAKWSVDDLLSVLRLQPVETRRHNCEGVVTGHTHFADDLRAGETHYLNSGCWTELPGGYVLSDGRGIRQHYLA